MTLFADRLTQRRPNLWLDVSLELVVAVSAGSICHLLAPVFAFIWQKMGDRQPSSPAKFAFGLFFQPVRLALLRWLPVSPEAGRIVTW